MAMKAKHAFGTLEKIDSALADGTIDSYDILFVKDANGKPYVGWIDKKGQKVIVDDSAEFAELEAQILTKANAESVTQLEAEVGKKANAEDVDIKIGEIETALDDVANASYTHEKIKYEITNVPIGTLVDYGDKEIRVMVPANSVWTKQSVGEGGDANSYYMTFKTYVYNDNVVGYREHLGNQVDSEILTDLKTDEYGRRYQPTWLALAKYDEATDAWDYYGENSSKESFIGWDYQIDWYDANGVMIASDKVRINLSNEQCHSSIEPYYVSNIMKEVDAKIEEKITEVNTSYEIVEF